MEPLKCPNALPASCYTHTAVVSKGAAAKGTAEHRSMHCSSSIVCGAMATGVGWHLEKGKESLLNSRTASLAEERHYGTDL